MNKYLPHIYVLPEDDANRQLANGFLGHHAVDDRRIQVMRPAGGWPAALQTLRDEYVPILQGFSSAHVVMLIDFDGRAEPRRDEFFDAVPADIRERVFVIGSRETPEVLKAALSRTYEEIGEAMAAECAGEAWALWDHDHLRHNHAERVRLQESVAPFLLPGG